MKKENGSRKLVLLRETLAPMQSDELEGVHGGVTPGASVVASLTFRATAAAAKSSQQCAAGIASFIGNSFSVGKLFGNK